MSHPNLAYHNVTKVEAQLIKTSYLNDGTPVITRRIVVTDKDRKSLELVLFADTARALEIKEEK